MHLKFGVSKINKKPFMRTKTAFMLSKIHKNSNIVKLQFKKYYNSLLAIYSCALQSSVSHDPSEIK